MTKLCFTLPSLRSALRISPWHTDSSLAHSARRALRAAQVGTTLGTQVCLLPIDCQFPRMPRSPSGPDAAQGSFPDHTCIWEHALSWRGDAMWEFQGWSMAARALSGCTVIWFSSINWAPRAGKRPQVLKMLVQRTLWAPTSSAPAHSPKAPQLAITETHTRGMDLGGNVLGILKSPLIYSLRWAYILSDKSSECFWACALPARGRMINREPGSRPGRWGDWGAYIQWFQVSSKDPSLGRKIWGHSSAWELGLPRQDRPGGRIESRRTRALCTS